MADLCKDAAERFLELHEIGVDTRDITQLVIQHFPAELRDVMGDGQALAFSFDSLYCSVTIPKPTNDEERRDFSRKASAIMSKYESAGSGVMGGMYNQVQELLDRQVRDPSLGRKPMGKVIDRLFAEAPKLQDASGNPVEGQAPALECVVVLATTSVPPISGVLSRTPEGALRMMSPAEIPDPTKDPRTKATKPVLIEQFFEERDVIAVVLQRDVTASPGSRIVSS
jgi:hypothetical protein